MSQDQRQHHDRLLVTNRYSEPVPLDGFWSGCAAFLVCSGPSLKELPLMSLRERGVLSIGINNAAAFIPTTAHVSADPAEKFSCAIWHSPTQLKFVPEPRRRDSRGRIRMRRGDVFSWSPLTVRTCPSVLFFKRDTNFNASTFLDTDSASWGRGAKALAAGTTVGDKLLWTPLLGFRLLVWLGVKEIYIIGMDGQMSLGSGYAFPQGRSIDAISSNQNLYRVANKELHALRPHFEERGVKCYNCNPKSAMSAFDYCPFEKALKRVRGAVPEGEPPLDSYYETKGKIGHVSEILQEPATQGKSE